MFAFVADTIAYTLHPSCIYHAYKSAFSNLSSFHSEQTAKISKCQSSNKLPVVKISKKGLMDLLTTPVWRISTQWKLNKSTGGLHIRFRFTTVITSSCIKPFLYCYFSANCRIIKWRASIWATCGNFLEATLPLLFSRVHLPNALWLLPTSFKPVCS